MSLEYSFDAALDDFSGLAIKDFQGKWVNISVDNLVSTIIKYSDIILKIFPMFRTIGNDNSYDMPVKSGDNPFGENNGGILIRKVMVPKELSIKVNDGFEILWLILNIDLKFDSVDFEIFFDLTSYKNLKLVNLYKFKYSKNKCERLFYNDEIITDSQELNESFCLFKELCI